MPVNGVNDKMDSESDLAFLYEIKDHLEKGLRNDPEEIKYGLKMVSDWIDEIEEVLTCQ